MVRPPRPPAPPAVRVEFWEVGKSRCLEVGKSRFGEVRKYRFVEVGKSRHAELSDPTKICLKISKTKFRVLIGPFDDIKSLRESFEKMNSFNFENLEILKNV